MKVAVAAPVLIKGSIALLLAVPSAQLGRVRESVPESTYVIPFTPRRLQRMLQRTLLY